MLKNAFKISNKEDCDDDAMHLAIAATVICNDYMKKYPFTGFFESNCQEHSVPQFLLSHVSMILHGSKYRELNENSRTGQSTFSLPVNTI